MAYSQPTDEAQTLALCQFCEESSDIRWKCINCDVFMCQLCTTKIHSKIKSSDQHELITLKDFGSEDVARTIHKVDLKTMPCTIHRDQICCAFCTECDQAVCINCLIESHQNHKYKTLNEVYDTTFSEMKDLQNKLESCLQFCGDEKERLEKLLLDGDKHFQVIKDQILLTEKEIKETVSKYAKELLQELESKWKPTENKIKTEISVKEKTREDLKAREESLKKTLQSHQALEMFSSRKRLDNTLPKNLEEQINCDILKTKFFSGKKFDKQNIKTIFGDLYAVPDFELVGNYQSDFLNVTNILNCDNNIIFIACRTEKRLQKVKFEKKNNKLHFEEEFSINVLNMAKLKNDEILIATGESDIKIYAVDKQFKSFKSFSPLKSRSVYVSKNNEIFVGLTECFPVTYPATKDSVRRVVLLNQEGDIQHAYEYDKHNQRLFTEPRQILTLKDCIYIIDQFENDLEGSVKALDYSGHFLWTYRGCDINLDKFYPSDILAATSSDMILVSDEDNHAIHVLNFAGELIICKDVKALGIELPLSLSIDSNGILWIGCNTWLIDNESEAKIVALKLV